jgi:hypothetical protein
MDFPRFVFTSPGPYSCNGGTYGSRLVHDGDEHSAALKVGFFATVPEALDALLKPKKVAEDKSAAAPAAKTAAPDKAKARHAAHEGQGQEG